MTGSLLTAVYWALAATAATLAYRLFDRDRLPALTLISLSSASCLTALSRAVRYRDQSLFVLADRLQAGATASLVLAAALMLLVVLRGRRHLDI